MPVKLRLMRMGKTKQPTYRVVASDSRSPRNGRFIELIGTYDPRQEPSALKIDAEKALKWIRNGAQPTERVQKILVAEGVLSGDEAAKTDAAKKAARRPAKPSKAAADTAGADAAAATEASASGETPAGTPDAGATASGDNSSLDDVVAAEAAAAAEADEAAEEKA